MFVAYVDWAMREYNGQNFIVMGRTVGSAVRNIIKPYMLMSRSKKKYKIQYSKSDNVMTVSHGSRVNTFVIFGAKDESAYMLIQGFTAAGCFVDEVALCVKSAVNQALGRCSVDGAKYFFNCNPDSPEHWFYKEWILQPEKQNALHLHFLLNDNPSLSKRTIERYERQFTGVFRDRYIKGLWTRAEGLIYPEYAKYFGKIPEDLSRASEWCVSCDYGTMNPFAAIKWAKIDRTWYAVGEYYYSGRDTSVQKADPEYASDMLDFCSDIPGEVQFIVDPSASSFIAELRKRDKFRVKKAKNDVKDGIRQTGTVLQNKIVVLSDKLSSLRGEMASYVWDEKSGGDGKERPVKENDHACDAMRYFVETKRLADKIDNDDYEPIF